MKRVLIFGGDGILGSHLFLGLREHHVVGITLHAAAKAFPPGLFAGAEVFDRIDAADAPAVRDVVERFRPDWILNAVGLVKRPLAQDPVASLLANTVFPHRLAQVCAAHDARLLHFSTDCVFSGTQGGYRESDRPDNDDWHGRCKALGEPAGDHVLVLRTSFIGLELGCKKSLLEWFLAQHGRVPGYVNAIWSGLTAIELARLTASLMADRAPLHGVWHVASPALSKFELLTRINARLGDRGVEVFPDEHFVCDRSLDGSAFAARTGYAPPSWDEMLDELVADIGRRWKVGQPSFWPS